MEKVNEFCWSCGKPPGECICSDHDDKTIIEIKKPENILPICGVEPPSDRKKKNLYPCCVCGKEWPATYDEWMYGRCPYCGAQGPHDPEIEKPTTSESSFIKEKMGAIIDLIKISVHRHKL